MEARLKNLLLMIPLLMATTAIGPCRTLPSGSLDGGIDRPHGAGGAQMDEGTGAARVDAGTGDAPVPDGGGGSSGGGSSGGSAGSAGAAGTGGAAGMPVGGSGGAAVQHPACDGIGWKTENVFYNTDRVQVPTEYDVQADDAGSVHLVARVSLAGNNATAYLRCLSGGNFEWPMTFVVQSAAATPRLGVEPNGRAHAAWTGSGANDNIHYDVMSDTGGWNVPETGVMGQMMAPLEVKARNGNPFVVFAVNGATRERGVAARNNGAWVSKALPFTGGIIVSALESNGTAHLLYTAAGGVTHAVVQPDLTLVTETVTTATVNTLHVAIDATDRVHAVYGSGGSTRYAIRGPAGWTEETVPSGLSPIAFRLDDAGNPHLVMSVSAGLLHGVRLGGAWTVENLGAAPLGGPVVEDSQGSVHVVEAGMPYRHAQICVPTDVVDARPAGQGTWRGRWSSARPHIRALGAMAYDSVRSEMVQYGGTASFPFDRGALDNPGTWTFPSAAGGWVDKSSATQPGPRSQPSMTFDSGRGRIVLMGDSTDTSVWEWDGAAWTSRASVPPMPALGGRVKISYDSARARVVVWSSDGIWDWSGATSTFVLRAAAPPGYVGIPIARGDTISFDGATGHIVGFGPTTWDWDPVANVFTDLKVPSNGGVIANMGAAAGSATTFAAYDGLAMRTWKRGQTSWTVASTAAATGSGPLPRSDVTMAFDPTRRAAMIFGGADPNAPTFGGIKIYTDPASPFWEVYSNNTEEWVPPAR